MTDSSAEDRLAEAARAIVAAIEDEGDFPNFHRETMARHRAEWPTLWAAIAALRAAIEEAAQGDGCEHDWEEQRDAEGRMDVSKCRKCGDLWYPYWYARRGLPWRFDAIHYIPAFNDLAPGELVICIECMTAPSDQHSFEPTYAAAVRAEVGPQEER